MASQPKTSCVDLSTSGAKACGSTVGNGNRLLVIRSSAVVGIQLFNTEYPSLGNVRHPLHVILVRFTCIGCSPQRVLRKHAFCGKFFAMMQVRILFYLSFGLGRDHPDSKICFGKL